MTDGNISSFNEFGAERFSGVITQIELAGLTDLFERQLTKGPGTRLVGSEELQELLAPKSSLSVLLGKTVGPGFRAVRALLFDKRPDLNWALGWHQDRTIVVREKRECAGFGPWSEKSGNVHVEPPFDILADMITVRVHVDTCGRDNAPLWIVPGSHKCGRIEADKADVIAARSQTFVCLAEAGDVWVYATPILHASKASERPTRRRVLQVDFSNATLPCGLEWLGV